jgi:hypothetical protein
MRASQDSLSFMSSLVDIPTDTTILTLGNLPFPEPQNRLPSLPTINARYASNKRVRKVSQDLKNLSPRE